MYEARTMLLGLIFMAILVPVGHAVAGASAGHAKITFVVA